MKKVNIIIGRFQPFTNGHMKCVEYAYEKNHCKTVILIVDTVKQDNRHPFKTVDLYPMFNLMKKNSELIEDYVLVKNADIVKNGEKLKSMGYEITGWVCGTDRYDNYKKMSDKYGKDILSDDFEVIEVPRGDEDVSATKAREALLNDDEKTFSKLCPKEFSKNFKKLKSIIDSI